MNKNKYLFVFLIVIILIALGVFFLISRPLENEKSSVVNPATVSTLSVSNVSSPASAVLAGAKTINWQTASYPTNARININLIRKVSESPLKFTLVRTLETDAINNGEYLWIPQNGENTSDLYVEVTCSNSYQFTVGCSLSSEPIKIN